MQESPSQFLPIPTIRLPSFSHTLSPLNPLPQAVIDILPDIRGVLRSLRSRLNSFSANQITVLHWDVFDCALKVLSRSTFDPRSRFDVLFVNEAGVAREIVEEGGPTQRFFLLLMSHIQHHNIFEGPSDSRALALDRAALDKGIYRLVGRMIAVCLVHGGVFPHFFSLRLFRQVCGLPALAPSIEELADPRLKNTLNKIATETSLDKVRFTVISAARRLSFIRDLFLPTSMAQRDELVTTVLQFHTEERIRAPLQQLREGLETLGLLHEITAHHSAFQALLMKSSITLSPTMGTWFLTSSRGSDGQEEIARQWDVLMEVKGGDVAPVLLAQVLTFDTDRDRGMSRNGMSNQARADIPS